MKEGKYFCYICGDEIKEETKTDEHIILNALGGHLHSYTVICKKCNNRMGGDADARLAEDLSFYTDMLRVKKQRQNVHRQVMTDEDGHEILVEDGGRSLSLRRPYIVVDKKDDETKIHLTVRNEKELKSVVDGLVRKGDLNQNQADQIMAKAKISEHNPMLKTQTAISQEAFPSIIKSAANFYVDKTHDIERVKHLVPYIEGQKDCRDVLYLYHFKKLPYTEVEGQATHMIHIEGTKDTGLLYAMMEYYSIYVYIVVIDSNYTGEPVNMTYTYDAVSAEEIERNFELPLTMQELEDFRNQSYEDYKSYLPYIQKRADNVMAIWDRRSSHEGLSEVIEKAFQRFPEGAVFTPEMAKQVEDDVMAFLEKKIISSFNLRKQ